MNSIDSAALQRLIDLGFDKKQVEEALKKESNDVDKAYKFLLSKSAHGHQADILTVEDLEEAVEQNRNCTLNSVVEDENV